MKIFLSLVCFVGVISGCGVKGMPLPPLTAPAIGRGKPTFAGRPERVTLDELNKNSSDDDTELEQNKSGPSPE